MGPGVPGLKLAQSGRQKAGLELSILQGGKRVKTEVSSPGERW